MAEIIIDINNVSKSLRLAKKNLLDMTRLFKGIADLELSETRLRFKREEDPDGKKWPDSITIRRDGGGGRGPYTREQSWNYVLKSNFHAVPPGWHWFSKSRGDKILRDTGTLFNSIGREYGKDFAIVGTALKYAKDHQDGRTFDEGFGPRQRRFLGINKKTLQNVDVAVEAYLKGLLK